MLFNCFDFDDTIYRAIYMPEVWFFSAQCSWQRLGFFTSCWSVWNYVSSLLFFWSCCFFSQFEVCQYWFQYFVLVIIRYCLRYTLLVTYRPVIINLTWRRLFSMLLILCTKLSNVTKIFVGIFMFKLKTDMENLAVSNSQVSIIDTLVLASSFYLFSVSALCAIVATCISIFDYKETQANGNSEQYSLINHASNSAHYSLNNDGNRTYNRHTNSTGRYNFVEDF